MFRKLTVILSVVALVFLTFGFAEAQMKYKEAPSLSVLVKAGKIPPIEGRLPKDPLVLDVEEGIGKYGGTLRTAHFNTVFAVEVGLVRREYYDRDTFQPQVAKSFEWGPDYRSITFRLREGMKWSDGHPYTADDIMFWWNDIVQSKWLKQPANVAGMNSRTDRVVKVDDHTVRFEFAEPRPKFLVQSRGGWSYGFYGYPAHYFKKLHPSYSPQQGMSGEDQFQRLQDRLFQNRWLVTDPDAPTILPWKTLAYKEGQLYIMERNPYYFAVDKEGNQLPYLDRVESLALTDGDRELIKLKVLAGEIDNEFRTIGLKDYPLYRESQQKADIVLITFDNIWNSPQGININQDYVKEPEVGKLLQNADFRRALSLSLDRELINKVAYLGLGEPGQGFSDAGVYSPETDGSYAQFDQGKANRLLDSIGLGRRDGEGFRVLPDGRKLTLTLMYRPGWGQGSDEVAEIARDSWGDVGIRMVISSVDGRLYTERYNNNEWQIKVYPGVGGWEGYWIYGNTMEFFAREEWLWKNSQGKQGVEPKGILKKYADLQWTAYNSNDAAETKRAFAELRNVLADQMFTLGTVVKVPTVLVINKALRNVPGQKRKAAIGQGETEYLRMVQWYYDR
jgi:peptide/nickel transport system substrate-binding protein